MLDHLEIRPSAPQPPSVDADALERSLAPVGPLERLSRFGYRLALPEGPARLQGVSADAAWSYAFDSDAEFERINLVVVDLPPGADGSYSLSPASEARLRQVTRAVAEALGWQVLDPETDAPWA